MRSVLCRRLLLGLLLGAAGWACPAQAAPRATPPAPDALASAQHFTELCTAKLQLAPEQATALHTYLDQEVNYLSVLALNGLAPETPALVPTEQEQLRAVMARLVSPTQLRQFHQLAQTPQAQAYLRSMTLLPEAAASLAGKPGKKRTGRLVAQRFDEAE